ncbi:hypothetical protein [Streptomyces sp. 5-6(2022)]|uniref:hypothetical protein n=1 Tax=Streptomyces sp. 5-6(2022) TaxID=2936510 RepID=UPI0023B9B287|nr:hypothetical protein [Streptomyces sp. 5-6(2022)]
MRLHLAPIEGVRSASTAPPRRTQAHCDAAAVDHFYCPTGEPRAGRYIKPGGQVDVRQRPTLDPLRVPMYRPVDVRGDEGAHSRRVGHVGPSAADSLEKALASQLLDGVLDDAATDAVLLLKLGVRGDAVSGRPVAGLDELSEAGGEPLVRRTSHLAGPQQRTIMKVPR